MFNRELNDRSIEKLKDYCAGKRVLLVGNAASLFNHEYGELIDSYDVVVRFGKGIPREEYNKHLGTKTDVWFFGSLRASLYNEWKDARFKIYNYTQIQLYNPEKLSISVPYVLTTDSFQIYRDYFVLGSSREHIELISNVHAPVTNKEWKSAPRISQGALAFLYFKEKINTFATLDLVGFDFFESKLKYRLDGKAKVIYSWHVPVPVDTHEQNPHGGDIEKDYILNVVANSNGRMNIHPMNTDLPSEISSEIILKNRPKAIPIK